MKNGAYYDYDQDKASYYKDEKVIAALYISIEEFESFKKMSASDERYYYELMIREYEEYQQAKEDNERYGEY